MFIKVDKSGYNKHGEQFCHGYFLLMMQPDTRDPEVPDDWRGPDGIAKYGKNTMRCAVVYTKFSQFGQFMMGRAHLLGHKLILSGAYGGDGLSCDVPWKVYQSGMPLPDDLYDAWNHGGGWNSAGSEAEAMKKFGLKLLKDRDPREFRRIMSRETE